MIAEAFFIGLIVGFIYYEAVGVSPGGVIAPAYLALYIHEPTQIVLTLVVATLTWGTISLLMPYLLLYGRRKMLLALVLGFVYGVLINRGLGFGSYLPHAIHSIGYLIPGLIASEMVRQKVLPTLTSLGIVMSFVYLVLLIIP
jgi:poly-gamma-glutamate biosynthesis protein PgsC/CapC